MVDLERDSSSTKQDLHDKIIAAADKAFTAHGIKSITMDDIAASVSISKRTLYEMFSEKETLLYECVVKHQHDMEDILKEVKANTNNVLEVILFFYQKSIERFHRTNKQFFEDIKKYPRVNELIKGCRDQDSDGTIAFFKEGVSQGIFRTDINFEITNILVHEQMDMLMNTDVCNKYPFIEVYESIMFTYLRGISTEKGSKVLENFIQAYRKNNNAQQQALA